MYYTIYKVTNLINGKYYIGKHQTNNLDDGYMGSGKLLKLAIKKYGIVNFKKDIIEIYDTEEKMNIAEKILVVVDSEISYNLCSGGKGGWGYINNSGIIKFKGKKHTEQSKKKMINFGNKSRTGQIVSVSTREKLAISMHNRLKGVPKSEEHRRKIAESVKKRHAERINAGIA